MNFSGLSLRDLEYVLAVADHGSFVRAAEHCRVAQPSLSAQVRKLESSIGIVIFERTTRKVLVTADGRAFIDQARRVLAEADLTFRNRPAVGHSVWGIAAPGGHLDPLAPICFRGSCSSCARNIPNSASSFARVSPKISPRSSPTAPSMRSCSRYRRPIQPFRQLRSLPNHSCWPAPRTSGDPEERTKLGRARRRRAAAA